MKKVILILAVILLLTGCENNDYKDYTFNEVTYRVPSSWKVETYDSYIYYYPKTGLLMVQNSDAAGSGNLTPDETEKKLNKFEDSMSSSFSDYEEIDSKKTSLVSNLAAREVTFYTTVKNTQFECKAEIFIYNNLIYSFCLGKPDEIKDSDLKIFNNIISSIKTKE